MRSVITTPTILQTLQHETNFDFVFKQIIPPRFSLQAFHVTVLILRAHVMSDLIDEQKQIVEKSKEHKILNSFLQTIQRTAQRKLPNRNLRK